MAIADDGADRGRAAEEGADDPEQQPVDRHDQEEELSPERAAAEVVAFGGRSSCCQMPLSLDCEIPSRSAATTMAIRNQPYRYYDLPTSRISGLTRVKLESWPSGSQSSG